MATLLNRTNLHSTRTVAILLQFLRIISLGFILSSSKIVCKAHALCLRKKGFQHFLGQTNPWPRLCGWVQLSTFPQGDFSGALVSFSASRVNQDYLKLCHWTSGMRKKLGSWNFFSQEAPNLPTSLPVTSSGLLKGTALVKPPKESLCSFLLGWWAPITICSITKGPPSGILLRKEKICAKLT